MSHLINPEMNPDWYDQEVVAGGNNTTVGSGDETGFFEKLNREIRFDWMEAARNRPAKPIKHIEPGQHIKVKAQETIPSGREQFLELCKKMNLTPKNTATGKHKKNRKRYGKNH